MPVSDPRLMFFHECVCYSLPQHDSKCSFNPAPCQNTHTTASGRNTRTQPIRVFTTICVHELSHTNSHTNLDGLEGQGHFPLAASLTLCFPGQPFPPTRPLIGNLDSLLSSAETKRLFLLTSPDTSKHLSMSSLHILSPSLPFFVPRPTALTICPLPVRAEREGEARCAVPWNVMKPEVWSCLTDRK